MFRQESKPLQDGIRRLSGRLVQLVDHQLGYQVQAGYKITEAVRVMRNENRQRARLQLRRIQARREQPDCRLHGSSHRFPDRVPARASLPGASLASLSVASASAASSRPAAWDPDRR